MIRELGTLGFFIKFNESASAALRFVEIFSSSAATTSLFSASTNSSNAIAMSANGSIYVNGYSASTISGTEWNHLSFAFNPKLSTDSENNFLVRFGNSSKGDFNIQNIYILDSSTQSDEILAIHRAFTGTYIVTSASSDATLMSLTISDKDESRHSSGSVVYQPLTGQTRFKLDVRAVSGGSLSTYTTNTMTGDNLYIDGIRVLPNDYILSLADNKVYRMQNNLLTETTTANGDYVRVLSGIEYKNLLYVKGSGSFSTAPFIEKVEYLGTELE